MEIPRESRRAREINLIPLVDIILMLVIFFMISTSFVASESMELSLPEGKADASTNAGKATRILIQPDGMVMVEGRRMDNDGLNTLLAQVLARDVDEKIAIFTTPGVSVQQLVSVMDTVYLTGGRNVQVDKIEQQVPNGA